MDTLNNEKLAKIKKELEDLTSKGENLDNEKDSDKIIKESKSRKLLKANEQVSS